MTSLSGWVSFGECALILALPRTNGVSGLILETEARNVLVKNLNGTPLDPQTLARLLIRGNVLRDDWEIAMLIKGWAVHWAAVEEPSRYYVSHTWRKDGTDGKHN